MISFGTLAIGAHADLIAVDGRPDGDLAPLAAGERGIPVVMKAGEIRRSFELNTAIVKAFHTMMMTTVKG